MALIPFQGQGAALERGMSNVGQSFADAIKQRRAEQLRQQELDKATEAKKIEDRKKLMFKTAELGLLDDVSELARAQIGDEPLYGGFSGNQTEGIQQIDPAEMTVYKAINEKAKRERIVANKIKSAQLGKSYLDTLNDAQSYLDSSTDLDINQRRENLQSIYGKLLPSNLIDSLSDPSIMTQLTNSGYSKEQALRILAQKASDKEVSNDQSRMAKKVFESRQSEEVEKIRVAEQSKGQAKAWERFGAQAFEDETSIRQTEQTYKTLREMLENNLAEGTRTTGSMIGTLRDVGNFAKTIGIDSDLVDEWLVPTDKVEFMEAGLKDLTTRILNRFKGALSNKELGFAEATQAGIGKTVEGNILILRMAEVSAKREKERIKFMRDMQDAGHSYGDAVEAWDEKRAVRSKTGDVDFFVNKQGDLIFKADKIGDAERAEALRIKQANPGMSNLEVAELAVKKADEEWRKLALGLGK
jgi:hypothetical protein